MTSTVPGGDAYGDLLEETRWLLDAVAAANAPGEVVRAVTASVRDARRQLAPFAAEEHLAPAGNRPDLPGRGHPLIPPVVTSDADDRVSAEVLRSGGISAVTGVVELSRHHLGGGGAAHGGVIPLLFDDVLGHLAAEQGPMSRTAYLHVDFRAPTPLGVPLQVHACVASREGRKILVRGSLLHGTTMLAEAEGLFVTLRPGQS
jgi:hypothetical protein